MQSDGQSACSTGGSSASSGTTSTENVNDTACSSKDNTSSQKFEPVDYKSHKVLLDQRKKDQERMDRLESELSGYRNKEKTKEENKLKQQGEHQKIITLREEEISKLRNDNEILARNIVDGYKKTAIASKLPAKLRKPEYDNFIQYDKVIFNPETKEVEASSVDSVVNDFLKEHHALLDFGNKKTLPNEAAEGNSNLSYIEELRALKKNSGTQKQFDELRKKHGKS